MAQIVLTATLNRSHSATQLCMQSIKRDGIRFQWTQLHGFSVPKTLRMSSPSMLLFGIKKTSPLELKSRY